MIYIVISPQSVQTKSQVNKILKTRLGESYDDFNVSRLDSSQDEMSDIITEMNQLPFGAEKKCVVVDNPPFLIDAKYKFEQAQMEKELTNTIQNPIDEIDVIFTVDSSLVNRKSKFFTLIEQSGGQILDFIDIPKEKMPEYIERYIEKHDGFIDHNAAVELSKRINGDLNALVNECGKLLLYNDHIKLVDVLTMVSKPLEDNVFSISNALLRGENMHAYDIYLDLKTANVEPVTLLSMLANQFRFIFQVKYLLKIKGLSNSEIASELKATDIRIKIAIQNSRNFTLEKLESILLKLSNLDKDIKSGQVDRFYAFELFLINFKL